MTRWSLFLQTLSLAGNEAIVSALQRTPAFAIADSSDNKQPLPAVQLKVVKSGEASTVAEERFKSLLSEEDIRGVLTAEVALTTRFFDYKARAEGVDPTQVERMDSWYGLVFEAADGARGITFSAIDFDSATSAHDHFEKIKSEASPDMQETDRTIGNASIEVEVNAQGIGCMLVFIKGDRLVSLHTAQPDDQEPLVSLAGLEELAELVASRP